MNSVEINGSFYSLQRRSAYAAWAAAVPEDFEFAVKGGRFITHMKKLSGIETPLANFFASGVLALDRKLGPLLWQLPPNLGFDPERMETFLGALPRTAGRGRRDRRRPGPPGARRPGPADRRTSGPPAAARGRGAARDLPDARVLRPAAPPARSRWCWPTTRVSGRSSTRPTTDLMYVRLHGHQELYASGYSDQALDEWAARIAGWRDAGQDVYIYCDNDAKVRAPYDAMGLMQRLGLNGATGDQAFDAILFDADGVVQTTDEKWLYAMTDLIGTDDEERVQRFLGDIMAPSCRRWPAGRRSRAARRGAGQWRVTRRPPRCCALAPRRRRPRRGGGHPGAAAQGMRCALATNQHPERAAYMRENLGYDEVFDELFYSCELGVAKPTRRTSPRPSAAGHRAGRTLLLDDNADNVAGARRPDWSPSCSPPTAGGRSWTGS